MCGCEPLPSAYNMKEQGFLAAIPVTARPLSYSLPLPGIFLPAALTLHAYRTCSQHRCSVASAYVIDKFLVNILYTLTLVSWCVRTTCLLTLTRFNSKES